jgi:peptidoglycan/xylan/chitin deacetylase (PgdA/CDA1 family)
VPALPPAWVDGELVRLPTTQHVVALTLDGGGNADGVRRALDTLSRTGTPATFFLTGRFVRLYPVLAREIGRRWVVGNHTVDHVDLTKVSNARAAWEIAAATTQIRNGAGIDPRPLFRFPYGYWNERVQAIAHRLGYVDVRWTVDTWGWMGRCCQTVAGVVRRVLAGLMPGEIVLMHIGSAGDGATLDTDALPAVVRAVEARGYRFVTLESVGRRGSK